MKKKCLLCEALNDAQSMICNICGGDLNFAEEVYEQAKGDHTPEKPSAQPPGECNCSYPQNRPGTDVCFACDKQIPSKAKKPVDPDTEKHDPEATSAVLSLPGCQNIVLDSSWVTLGRDKSSIRADIAVALSGYRGVSRQHLRLAVGNGAISLIDLGSRNGTWINGTERLVPHVQRTEPVSALPMTIWLGGKLKISIKRNR